MNRKEQFYKRNTAFSDYETILSANAAAMSFVPWTKAYAFLPSLQATLSKPFKYTGINQWQQRDIGVVSKDGMNINSEALGIKNGMSDMNNDSGIYVGDAQQDQYKSKHERDNAAFKLVNDIASVAGGTISSISSIATQTGSKTADMTAKGIEQGSELAATEAIKATSEQGIEQGTKLANIPSKPFNTSTFQTKPLEQLPQASKWASQKSSLFNIGNNVNPNWKPGMHEPKYDVVDMSRLFKNNSNYADNFANGDYQFTIEDIQKAVKIMSEVKQAKEEIKKDVEQYKNNYI
jgi:hypothetical protein